MMKRESYDLIIGIAAAAFLPNIFFYILFNNNKIFGEHVFIHSVIMAAVFSAISIGAFLLFRLITRKAEAALFILIVSWIPFWLFGSIYSSVSNIIDEPSRRVLVIIHAIVIIALLLLLRKFNPLEKFSQVIFRALSLAIAVIFMFNFVPTLYTEISVSASRPSEQVFDIKADFIVDQQLPSPDVYWLHMDGMMSFDTIYKYFGDSQDELKAELEQRGFVINEDAALNAGYTQVATVAMLSPTFYDSYLGMQLNKVDHLLNTERTLELLDIFESDGVYIRRDVANHNELYKAFMAKGYNTVIIGTTGYGIYPIDHFYRLDDDNSPYMVMGTREVSEAMSGIDLIMQLLLTTTSLSAARARVSSAMEKMQGRNWLPIPDYDDEIDSLTKDTLDYRIERRLYRRLLDTFTIESPKLAFVSNDITHSPYGIIRVENDGDDNTRVNRNNVDVLYPIHHEYAIQVLLNTIDLILDRTPDAVIIIQGDHGVHRLTTQEYMLGMGYTIPQILEMNFSVMSAVRIPPQYGDLEEPMDPLNITRFLVNHLVGENFEMLTGEQE